MKKMWVGEKRRKKVKKSVKSVEIGEKQLKKKKKKAVKNKKRRVKVDAGKKVVKNADRLKI